MKLESITPMEATSRSHSGRWTATSSSGVPKVSTMMLFKNDAVDCATRAARISIPKSRNLRRHSTTSPTAAGMSEATPWNRRYSARASASGKASKALIVSRSNPTSVFDAPAAISRPRSARSTPTMRWSTSDGVRTWRSAGGSSISVLDRRRLRGRRLSPRPVAVRGDGDDAHDEGAGRDHQVRRGGGRGDAHGSAPPAAPAGARPRRGGGGGRADRPVSVARSLHDGVARP